MTRPFASFCLAMLATLAGTATAAAETDPTVSRQLEEYRAAMKAFGSELKKELKQAMQSSGPLAAVSVCHARAPQIAAQISARTGFDLHRTSLKPRKTAPLAWEKPVLEQFEQAHADGQSIKTLEWHEVADVAGTPTLRYMKPIRTEAICLTCHGSHVEPQLLQKIRSLYPHDQATGFRLGDIRGAFSISAPLRTPSH